MTQDAMTGPIPEEDLLAWHENALGPELRAALAPRIAASAEAQALLADWAAQDTALAALHAGAGRGPLPEGMARLLAEARAADAGSAPASDARRRGPPLLRAAAMAGFLVLGSVLGAAGGWLAADLRGPAAPAALLPHLAAEAIRAHATYAVEKAHPVEVAADGGSFGNGHLTRWLSRRLGQEIRAPDFGAEGFRLIGGRLLPGDDAPAALLMYENDLGQRVTLYACPESGATDTAFQFAQSGGLESFWWVDGPLSYAVVGDIPRDKLRAIALAAYDQLI